MPVLTEKQPEAPKRRRGLIGALVALGGTLALILALVVAPLPVGDKGVRLGPFWICSSRRPYTRYYPIYWGEVTGNDLQGAVVFAAFGGSSYRWAACYDPKRQIERTRN
jgi:hypothetical protein